MKTTTRLHSKSSVFVAVCMALVLAAILAPAVAHAWTKKTLKTIHSYDSVSTQVAKSAKVKKAGKYKLVFKGGNGIVKFTAPKTKKYSFTFSRLKSSDVEELACIVGLCKVSGSSYTYKSGIPTKEGKRPRLPIVSAAMANGKWINFDGYKYRRIKARTGTIKLNKGKSIYVVVQAKDMDDSLVPATMRMQIK